MQHTLENNENNFFDDNFLCYNMWSLQSKCCTYVILNHCIILHCVNLNNRIPKIKFRTAFNLTLCGWSGFEHSTVAAEPASVYLPELVWWGVHRGTAPCCILRQQGLFCAALCGQVHGHGASSLHAGLRDPATDTLEHTAACRRWGERGCITHRSVSDILWYWYLFWLEIWTISHESVWALECDCEYLLIGIYSFQGSFKRIPKNKHYEGVLINGGFCHCYGLCS